jgi:hypothetical protein
MISRALAGLLLASSILFSSLPAHGEFTPKEWRSLKSQVMGTIRDVSGVPLAKAKVVGMGTEWSSDGRSGQQKTFETYTDSLGSYRLEVPAGADLVWVEHPDTRNLPEREWLLRGPIEPGEHRVDHQFHLYRVHGKLLGGNSLPAPRGLVLYYPTPTSPMCGTGLPQASVSNGSFELTVQHPASMSFVASLSTQPFGVPNVYKVIQINGDTTITIQVGGIPIEGTVHGYGGLPLRHVRVSVSSADFRDDVRTDATGRFRASVTKGRYRWMLQGENQEFRGRATPDSALIAAPGVIALSYDAVRWRGRVRDARSGVGLDSIWVQAYSENYNDGGAYCITGPLGEFDMFVPRGPSFDLSLYDYAIPRIPLPVDVTPEQVDRAYARVHRRTIKGVPATRDSTFEITMRPMER